VERIAGLPGLDQSTDLRVELGSLVRSHRIKPHPFSSSQCSQLQEMLINADAEIRVRGGPVCPVAYRLVERKKGPCGGRCLGRDTGGGVP
jgi:hypothetical protein